MGSTDNDVKWRHRERCYEGTGRDKGKEEKGRRKAEVKEGGSQIGREGWRERKMGKDQIKRVEKREERKEEEEVRKRRER